jgi:hypothetical protein
VRFGPTGLEVQPPRAIAGSVPSEWWSNPPPAAQQNARDEEFTSDVLSSSFAWWTDPTIGSGLTPATADDSPLLVTSLPAVRPRYQCNKRRPSWLQVQVPKSSLNAGGIFDAGSWWCLKPLTPNADDSYYSRVQNPNVWVTGGSGSSGVCQGLVLMAATGGVPDKNNALVICSQGNIGSSTGSSFANFYTVLAGVTALRPLGSFDQSIGAFGGFGIGRRASSNWRGIFMPADSTQTRVVEEFAQAFTPAFIGWWWRVQNAVTFNPIVGADLLRCPASANTLPL